MPSVTILDPSNEGDSWMNEDLMVSALHLGFEGFYQRNEISFHGSRKGTGDMLIFSVSCGYLPGTELDAATKNLATALSLIPVLNEEPFRVEIHTRDASNLNDVNIVSEWSPIAAA